MYRGYFKCVQELRMNTKRHVRQFHDSCQKQTYNSILFLRKQGCQKYPYQWSTLIQLRFWITFLWCKQAQSLLRSLSLHWTITQHSLNSTADVTRMSTLVRVSPEFCALHIGLSAPLAYTYITKVRCNWQLKWLCTLQGFKNNIG